MTNPRPLGHLLVQALHVPRECANVECPNKSHEGVFALYQTRAFIVGGHRGVSLWLCAPCADALVGITREELS